MTATPWLWAVFTIAAAFAQTIRNAMQHDCRRDTGAFSVRLSIAGHFGCQDWRAAATPRIDVLGQGTGWGIYSDPRDGAYAGRDG